MRLWKEQTMSRYSELRKGLEARNQNGGASRDEWYMFLLTDMAVSLAVIADQLKGDQEGADE